MPTVKGIPGPYRFFFYSFDCNEPEHIHVQREDRACKYWLRPVALVDNEGFNPRELRIIRDEIVANLEKILEVGMSIVVSVELRLHTVTVTDDQISADLSDGRTIAVPLAWSWRLSEATPAQRQHFEIIGNGTGIHWPEIDEDISVQGMLHGIPARRPR